MGSAPANRYRDGASDALAASSGVGVSPAAGRGPRRFGRYRTCFNDHKVTAPAIASGIPSTTTINSAYSVSPKPAPRPARDGPLKYSEQDVHAAAAGTRPLKNG